VICTRLLSDQSPRRCGTAKEPYKTQRPVAERQEALSLKKIGSRRFHRFLPAGNHLGTVIGEEVEWFADGPENAIGTIAFNTNARGWNYAILRRDWKGDFQVCDLKVRFQSFPATRADLLLAMRTGRKTNGGFPLTTAAWGWRRRLLRKRRGHTAAIGTRRCLHHNVASARSPRTSFLTDRQGFSK